MLNNVQHLQSLKRAVNEMRFSRTILSVLFALMVAAAPAFGQQSKPVAEDFSALSMDGSAVELGSLRGKVVVMTFWSTRCAICVAEIPRLNQMAKSFSGRDVVFIGLTTDSPSLVERFVKNRPFDFNIVPDSLGVLMKYADRDGSGNLTMGFPAYFVVNQQGEIEMKANGWNKVDALNGQVNRLLSVQMAKKE